MTIQIVMDKELWQTIQDVAVKMMPDVPISRSSDFLRFCINHTLKTHPPIVSSNEILMATDMNTFDRTIRGDSQ